MLFLTSVKSEPLVIVFFMVEKSSQSLFLSLQKFSTASVKLSTLAHSTCQQTSWVLKLHRRLCQMFHTQQSWTQHGTRQCQQKTSCMLFHMNGTKSMQPASTVSTEHHSFTQQSVPQFSLERSLRTQTHHLPHR